MWLSLILLTSIISASVGFHVGLYLSRLLEITKNIWNRDPEPLPQVITPKRPGEANVMDLSGIVTPKSPEQVEREEQARVRDL